MCVGITIMSYDGLEHNPGYSRLTPSVPRIGSSSTAALTRIKQLPYAKKKTIHITVCSPWLENKLLWVEGVEGLSVLENIILTIIVDPFVKYTDVTRMLWLYNPQRTWT